MTLENQNVYSPTDIQELLQIDSSTLRKYALLLERYGYKFLKNERGHRGYVDKDIITLRKMLDFSKHTDMTLERSVEAVMTWISQEGSTVSDIPETALQDSKERDEQYQALLERLDGLEEYARNQDAFNKGLLLQLQKRDEYIRKRDEERDANLMKLIREQQETKKMIAVAEEKKSWWQRLFKK